MVISRFWWHWLFAAGLRTDRFSDHFSVPHSTFNAGWWHLGCQLVQNRRISQLNFASIPPHLETSKDEIHLKSNGRGIGWTSTSAEITSLFRLECAGGTGGGTWWNRAHREVTGLKKSGGTASDDGRY